MDFRTWKKIKESSKKAAPIARLRKFHFIIKNPRIPKKIREEAKELANKARVELDQQHFWRWRGGAVLPTSRTPQLEEQVREEKPERTLEQTVETAAPDVKPKEQKIDMKYGSSVEGGYISQDYSTDTYRRETEEAEFSRAPPAEDAMKTASEKLSTETKYHRKAKVKQGY